MLAAISVASTSRCGHERRGGRSRRGLHAPVDQREAVPMNWIRARFAEPSTYGAFGGLHDWFNMRRNRPINEAVEQCPM